MFRFTLIFVILNLATTLSANSVTLFSISNGNWTNGNTWSTVSHSGPACNCTPSSTDLVYIEHNVVLNKNLINQGTDQNGIAGLLHIKSDASLTGGGFDVDIRSTGNLYLCGNLTAKNMVFSNGSVIMICSSASLNLSGNFENKNNGNNVTVHGNMVVGGSFTNGSGSIMGGSGAITITNGPLINNGTVMGCTNNPCNSYPCDIMANCSTVLPVELQEFFGEPFSNYIKIYWRTASEKNNEYFLLEKSSDGINFSELSKINGNGTTSLAKEYTFSDIYPSAGNNYYKLTQYDFDGKSKSYNIIQVTYKNINILSVHPNPTLGKSLNISVTLPDEEATMEILDYSGSILYRSVKNITANEVNKFTIEESKNLPQGLYTLRIVAPSGTQQEKLFITN